MKRFTFATTWMGDKPGRALRGTLVSTTLSGLTRAWAIARRRRYTARGYVSERMG